MGSGVHSLGYFLFEVSNLGAWDERRRELGWGRRTLDDSTRELAAYDRISDWGHQSPYRRPPKRQTEMGEQP